MAAHSGSSRSPREEPALNPIEIRLSGGMLALNRFLMTLQNKRIPVAHFTLGRDDAGMRATVVLECPPENARRYATLLAALEDVERLEETDETAEVALVKVRGGAWREPAERLGVGFHEEGNTLVASGEPGALRAWLDEIGENVEDTVRLGPVARPGDGGE